MKKLKFNLGEGGVKGFLIRHVEKIVLLVAVVLVAVFFCLGYSAEGLPANKTPSALKDRISQVTRHINDNTWGKIAPGRTPEMRYPERVDEGRQPNDYRNFPLVALDPPSLRQKTPRTDPRLFKPIKLEVYAKYVPIAHTPATRETDKIAGEDLAVKKASAAKAKSSTTPSTTKPKKTGVPDSSDLLGGTSYPMPTDDSGSGAMPYGPSGTAGEIRQLTPAQYAELKGFEAADGAIAKSKFLVAIKAVVPYELQCKEYERCFANSNDYDPMRDTPLYYWFYVERAEVPAGASPDDPLVWTRLNTKQVWDMANPEVRGNWWGVAEELADYDYTDEVLTLPIPPVLMDDLKNWALHSEVPERKDVLTYDDPEDEPRTPSDEDGPDGPVTRPGGTGGGADGMTPGMPGTGPRRPGAGSRGGESGMMGRGPRGVPGSSRPGGPGSMPGAGRQPGMPRQPGMSGMGPGAPGMGPGMPGMPGYGSGSTAEIPLPKYKLLRFYDLKADPGKTYRYRMMVRLIDPNRPDDPALDPSIPSLDPAVAARVKAQDAKDGGERKTFWVDSEWSDPSDPVSVPPTPQKLLAGSVLAPRATVLGTGSARQTAPRFFEKEPQMTLAATIWDEDRAVPVALELDELYRGSVLNRKTEVDVLHPVYKSFHTIKDYPFATGAILLDIRGGEVLPDQKIDREDPFQAPGEFLLIDRFGNLQVGDEFEDIDSYRRELFIEAEPPQTTNYSQGMPTGYDMPSPGPVKPGTGAKKGSNTPPGMGPPGMTPPGVGPPGMSPPKPGKK